MGSALIADLAEREEIARFNLLAGHRAKTATAYRAAIEYFQGGLQLLAPDCWQTTYDLSLALYEAAAEAAYLNNDLQQMEEWAEVVLQQAKTLMEKVKVYQVKIAAVVAQGDLKEAVQLGLQVLALLGLVIPEAPSPSDIQNKLAETTARLNELGIETLLDLPKMTDPRPACGYGCLHQYCLCCLCRGTSNLSDDGRSYGEFIHRSWQWSEVRLCLLCLWGNLANKHSRY